METKITQINLPEFTYRTTKFVPLSALLLLFCLISQATVGQSVQKRNPGRSELKEESYTLYPNPSPGKFFVMLKDVELPYDINVYNLIGKMVYHWESQSGTSQAIEVNLSKQPRGVYFVELDTEKGNMIKKIVIDHEKEN